MSDTMKAISAWELSVADLSDVPDGSYSGNWLWLDVHVVIGIRHFLQVGLTEWADKCTPVWVTIEGGEIVGVRADDASSRVLPIPERSAC